MRTSTDRLELLDLWTRLSGSEELESFVAEDILPGREEPVILVNPADGTVKLRRYLADLAQEQ